MPTFETLPHFTLQSPPSVDALAASGICELTSIASVVGPKASAGGPPEADPRVPEPRAPPGNPQA